MSFNAVDQDQIAGSICNPSQNINLSTSRTDLVVFPRFSGINAQTPLQLFVSITAANVVVFLDRPAKIGKYSAC